MEGITTHSKSIIMRSYEREVTHHQTLCRLCGNDTVDFVNIFNDDGLERKLSVKAMSCLHIQVSMSDVLPTIICTNCCNMLNNFHEFLERATEVQVYLQNLCDSSILYTQNYIENDSTNSLEIDDEKSSSKEVLKSKDISSNRKISKVLRGYAWTCTLCDFTDVKSVNNLHDHYRLAHHDTPPIYKCIHCERRYNKYRSFTKHFLLHESPKVFECDLCGKIFNLKSSLISHGLVHTHIRPYSCSVCQKTFKSTVTLSVHEKLHQSEGGIKKKFCCQICKNEFSSKKTLDNHEKMHKGVKNFMCDICGKAFVTTSSLAYHLKSHSMERNHICSACGSAFRTKRHPYCCNICKKSFRERSTLIGHTRIHTGEMPYSCEYCGKRFRFAGILTVHRRIHTGEKPYSCSNCERTFTNWANLNKHINRVHSNHNNSIEGNSEVTPTKKPN